MKYQGVKIPKPNGRPQLWTRASFHTDCFNHTSLRIIYPDGHVAWHSIGSSYSADPSRWDSKGCTSESTQLKAIKRCIDYDSDNGKSHRRPWFLGYL